MINFWRFNQLKGFLPFCQAKSHASPIGADISRSANLSEDAGVAVGAQRNNQVVEPAFAALRPNVAIEVQWVAEATGIAENAGAQRGGS